MTTKTKITQPTKYRPLHWALDALRIATLGEVVSDLHVQYHGADEQQHTQAPYPTSSIMTTQPENTAMTTTKLIESKTLILGREAEAMSDSEIFKLIAKTENELASLKTIRTPSKKLEAHIAKTEAELKRLAEYVDSREEA